MRLLLPGFLLAFLAGLGLGLGNSVGIPNRNHFSHAPTNISFDFVSNSGVCETTPGVKQYSGYVEVGNNQHMWFWFFEARKNPQTAPLALWLNGGPGCSSMLGLLQENGPCKINKLNQTEPELNPYSWNNFANMLYVDQPIGAGFSYGNVSEADTTVHAAPVVWRFLQAFFTRFPEYASRDFGLFTESYGGHYGPEFAHYFEDKNRAIRASSSSSFSAVPVSTAAASYGASCGAPVQPPAPAPAPPKDNQHHIINLVALGINNGWFDQAIQERAYIDYAVNNTYRPLLSAAAAKPYVDAFETHCQGSADLGRCVANPDRERAACAAANQACYEAVEEPLEKLATFDAYDIRADTDSFLPDGPLDAFLARADIRRAIGAHSTYRSCRKSSIGDWDEAHSFKHTLQQVIQSNITVLIWAGDADWVCNWMGVYDVVESIASKDFLSAPLRPYTVAGKQYGEYKTFDNLSWLRVFEAGHEIPAYQPEASLAAFISTMSRKPLQST